MRRGGGRRRVEEGDCPFEKTRRGSGFYRGAIGSRFKAAIVVFALITLSLAEANPRRVSRLSLSGLSPNEEKPLPIIGTYISSSESFLNLRKKTTRRAARRPQMECREFHAALPMCVRPEKTLLRLLPQKEERVRFVTREEERKMAAASTLSIWPRISKGPGILRNPESRISRGLLNTGQ